MKSSNKNIAKALFELAKENPKAIKKIVSDFYFYLLKTKKIKILPFIIEDLEEVEREEEQIKQIEIESAHPLTQNQRNKIKKLFGKKVMLKEKINPNLLAGIIIKTKDTLIDGSVKNSLEALKEKLCQIPIK
jgi:F-type H+-transporting ATPase subunit delta